MKKILRIIYPVVTVMMLMVCSLGIYAFFTAPSKAIKAQNEIEEMIKANQEESEKQKEEQKQLAGEYTVDENIPLYQIYTDAYSMHLTIIGDSVTVSAMNELKDAFPNAYIDAAFGRTIYKGIEIIKELEQENSIGDAVVFSLGANSTIEEEDCEELISHCKGRPTFWVTTYGVDNDSNEVMKRVVARHDNAFMIDWESLAMENRQWILSDHLHPNQEGSKAYAELLNKIISESLLKPYQAYGNDKGC